MSTSIRILCDASCLESLEMGDSIDSVFDYDWGQVYAHDEHYCEEHWPQYCEENNVNPETGRDIVLEDWEGK